MNEVDTRTIVVLKDILASLYCGVACTDESLATLIREKIKLIVERVK